MCKISMCLALGLIFTTTGAVAALNGENMAPEDSTLLDEEKRSTNWFSKAVLSLPSQQKRKFYQWAGKRNMEESMDLTPEKRKFYQWAGKRGDNPFGQELHDWADSRPYKRKFYAWAGKRNFDNEGNMDAPEKRKFYQWAG